MADTAPDLPVTMKVYSQSGTLIQEFPYFTNLQVMDLINDVGSFTFNYNFNSPGASNLISDTALQMAVCIDYKDGNGFTEVWRGWYEQDTYDPANNESAIIQASGRSMVAVLGQAVVYPQGGIGSTTASWSFTGASAGTIMNTLIAAAQTRGCFPGLTTSFTNGQDSSGNAWVAGYTNAFSAGTNYLDLLTGLAQGGLCDFNMSGQTLNIYNPKTTLATDRSSTVLLTRSRDVVTISAQRDRTQISTAMLAIGDNGLNHEYTAPTLGTLGRYETYLSETGITDITTLGLLANQALAATDDQQLSYTTTGIFYVQQGTPKPWIDFKPGDYISLDYAGTPTKFRATAWTLQAGTGGPMMFQPTLNDVFYSREVLLQNRLDSVTGGSITGAGGVAVTGTGGTAAPGKNPTVPNAPAFQTASCYTAAYYSPATGTTLAQLELQWTTPTNTDGTTMIDGSDYLVQYRISNTPIYPIAWSQLQGKTWASLTGNPWSNPLATPQNQQWTTVIVGIDNNNLIVSGLICGETYEFQIACTDVSGNTSVFSGITSFATATDNVAPVQPDAPVVSASMVAVQVMHDLGSEVGGTFNLAQDLDHLEVHFSYDPSFSPVPGIGSATYLGKLIANAGMMAAQVPAVGTFQVTSTSGIYIKVIAVDESGNTSPASPGSGVTAVLIDDSHISSLSVTKLIAGTISAAVIVGSTISTASSGARVTMDGTTDSFEVYDSSGVIMTKMDSTGFNMYDTSSNSIANWNHGGLTIYNGPHSGKFYISTATSTGLTPFFNWDVGSGNSSSLPVVYVLQQGTGDQLTIQGATTASDTGLSAVSLSLIGAFGSSPAPVNGAVFNFGFTSTNTHINGTTILGGGSNTVFAQQVVGGGGVTPTSSNVLSGCVLQNDDGGTGIYPHFFHAGSTQVTTDTNGNSNFSHGAGFTPTGGVVGFYGGGSGTGYQYAWVGGTPFGSANANINIRNSAGANVTSAAVNLYYIFWA